MDKKFKDYSQRFLSFNPENRDISPYIILAGVNEAQQDEFMDLIYVPFGTISEEKAYMDSQVRNHGEEYNKKALNEVYEKCKKYEELKDAPEKVTKKAKTVTTILTIATVLLLIVSLTLNFM